MEMGPRIITNGLRLALDAADQGSYPGTGVTWNDLSSNGFNGTLVNGVGYSNTGFGSMVLDGVDDYIQAPPGNTIGAIPDQTLEIWVKSSGLGPSQGQGGLIEYGYYVDLQIGSSGALQYRIYSIDTGPSVNITNLSTTGVNCFDNIWHHIVCTRNSADAVIYVDGISRASGSGGGAWSGTTSSDFTVIGDNTKAANRKLMGNIGLARIYNKALTATEVLQNYKALKPRFKLN